MQKPKTKNQKLRTQNQKPKTKTKKTKPVFAKKSFGQNFLVDENYIGKIIAALNPESGETIIEIGPGRGALTEKLIEAGMKVIAIELERSMQAVMRERFGEVENFVLIEDDALRVDFKGLVAGAGLEGKIKLVANLPYNISTAILQKLIEQRDVFSQMILMFQREVVERITAPVGSSDRGYLTILTEASLDSEKLFDVPPSAFVPPPQVWSSIVRLTPKLKIIITPENERSFREIVSHGFLQKRKTILNNLKSLPPALKEKTGDAAELLESCGIEPQRRPETLTVEEWKCLSQGKRS